MQYDILVHVYSKPLWSYVGKIWERNGWGVPYHPYGYYKNMEHEEQNASVGHVSGAFCG